MGRLGQTWGWGTIVCTVKTVTLTMKVNTESEIFVGEKGREGREALRSSLLISLISTNFLLAFYHHTFSFLNGDFSFLSKDYFLSVFHSFIWCIFRFEIQQSLELRANQFNTHKIHWQEGFKLVVRNKAVSNSTNSSGKIVFKII